MPESQPPPPEVHFGRYRDLREIGRGGMATVYLAYDPVLDIPVVVKLLFADLTRDTAALESLRKEVLRAMKLANPHILRCVETAFAAQKTVVPPSAASPGWPC